MFEKQYKDPEYRWDLFDRMNGVVREMFRDTGVHIIRTHDIYKLRKEYDLKTISQDGLHFCGPGPASLNTFTFRLFLHKYVSNIYDHL